MLAPLRPLATCVALYLVSVGAKTVPITDKHIFFNGRWDDSPGTWWTGSGLKLNVKHLTSLTLNLGNHTTTPFAPIGVSLNYGPFVTANVSVGSNIIPIDKSLAGKNTVVRISSEGWQNNRVNLESIEINEDAKLDEYKPSKLVFQFIGDSLSAGQYLPQGVDQAWPFLASEFFKAEHTVIAQPGATLTEMVSYGNQHGIETQFFKTEDCGYFYSSDHNFTSTWDFSRDQAPTHVIIHIGANDSSHNITAAAFVSTYLTFLAKLRFLYPKQPFFIFTPWGWPNPDGTVNSYYQGSYENIVNARKELGDKYIYLVDTTGWVGYEDIFSDNSHPNVPGHQNIAASFQSWLQSWGLEPESEWKTKIHT